MIVTSNTGVIRKQPDTQTPVASMQVEDAHPTPSRMKMVNETTSKNYHRGHTHVVAAISTTFTVPLEAHLENAKHLRPLRRRRHLMCGVMKNLLAPLHEAAANANKPKLT